MAAPRTGHTMCALRLSLSSVFSSRQLPFQAYHLPELPAASCFPCWLHPRYGSPFPFLSMQDNAVPT